MTQPLHTNALAAERSPYLLQHAHNPVDWLPWGDEAFERARALDRPVFLSVGYSACHWCHVMEHESFEDPETAALLNERFVSIKVDREERPDVDQVYQLAYQALAQRGGGWPLSMFLTPDRQPFTGGTYFPNARKYGMPSFREVLTSVHDAWTDRREELVGQARELTEILGRITRAEESSIRPEAVDRAALSEVCAALLRRADRTHGGFGAQPKFPNTMALDLLVAHTVFNPSAATASDARSFVRTTLTEMSHGGIYDHLGGGFARYSTDRVWRVPHFEKMLYDNAQLARLYVDGWRLFGDERFAGVARSVFAYVAREMTSAQGCFYSAQDADSEGEEGRFFAWTPSQISAVVGDDAPVVCAWFDVTPEGNFEHGKSVLWTPRSREEVSSSLRLTPDALDAVIARVRPTLWASRETRVHPNLDDKCLASWNGQMISALADAGAALHEPTWVAAAVRALDAWQTRAFTEGRVAHAIKHETPYGQGFLDDHAALCLAALDVFEASFSARALAFARALGESILARFVDEATGEFYFSPRDGEVVLHRSRDPHDHAYPGGTGMACDALLRLSELTGDGRFHAAAGRCVARFAASARENPMAMATVLRALDRLARGSVEVVVMGDPAHPSTQAALASARGVMVPHRVIVCARTSEEAVAAGVAPSLVRDRSAGEGGEAVVYVCRSGVCSLPVRAPADVAAALRDAVRG